MAKSRKVAAVVTRQGRLLDAPSSFAILPESSPLIRRPRAPTRLRGHEFLESYESRVLFYDAFWHADGQRILLVGPPPLNLGWDFQTARFTALPLDFWLASQFHISQSVMVTELYDVPQGTTEVVVRLGPHEFVLPVRQNFAPDFAGRNVIFTMSKDNDLNWITEWARYHARVQGADAAIVFDNGSTRYATEEIEAALLAVPELARVAVLSWPHRYGSPDRAVFNNPYYTLFLQMGAMSVTLRRFAALANGLLNCDIDELVATPEGTNIFDLLPKTRHGLIVMRGQYMEAVPAPRAPSSSRSHRHYPYRLADPGPRQSRQKKWALAPRRDWVASLGVHPYMHWIHGRPWFGKSSPEGVFYRHFRAISTGWKDNRTTATHLAPEQLELDAAFTGLQSRW